MEKELYLRAQYQPFCDLQLIEEWMPTNLRQQKRVKIWSWLIV